MVCSGGPINGPDGSSFNTDASSTAALSVKKIVDSLKQPGSGALAQNESGAHGGETLKKQKTPDEILADMLKIVSGRARVSASEINRVFAGAFGSFPYDIRSIGDRIFPILENLGTQYGTHQRRVLSYILAWIEVSGKSLNVKLRDFLFGELAPQTLTISQLNEIDASDEQVARQVFEIFDALRHPKFFVEAENKAVREQLFQASSLSDSDDNPQTPTSTGSDASNVDPSHNNEPDKCPPKPMEIKAVIDEYFSRERNYPQENLLNYSTRKLKLRDIGRVAAIYITRPPELSTIGCIKDKLLTGTIDNGDTLQFLSLIPNEQAYSFYEILAADYEKGHKRIGQLISMVSKNLHLLEIFKYFNKPDAVEILENTKPSVVYQQFSKWLDDYPNFIKEEALEIFDTIFTHGSKYPFLYSLIEKVPAMDLRKMHYRMRITSKDFDADLAETARGGLKQIANIKIES